jgi:hypothetical protein
MGPPLPKPPKLTYAEFKRRIDTFEYRKHPESDDLYMFNPYTGETVSSHEFPIRAISMWAPYEKFPSEVTQRIELFPEYYMSRSWGRRRFEPEDEEGSATRINAVARGFIARQALRRIFRERFYTMLDPVTGYYYYVDSHNPHSEPDWHKPRLAFPLDIKPYEELARPEWDYMVGDKYSNTDLTKGPLVQCGKNKHDVVRSHCQAFLVDNDWKPWALTSNAEIDLDNTPLGTIIAWLDDAVVVGKEKNIHTHMYIYE